MLCSDRTEKKGQPAHSIGLSPARGRDQVRGVGVNSSETPSEKVNATLSPGFLSGGALESA